MLTVVYDFEPMRSDGVSVAPIACLDLAVVAALVKVYLDPAVQGIDAVKVSRRAPLQMELDRYAGTSPR